MKLSDIMIGLVFSIILFIGLFTFLTDGVIQYGVESNLPSEYNQSFIVIKGELDNINKTTSGIKAQLSDITAQSGILDYLGFFFNAGYKALTGAGQITKSLFIITDESIEVTGGLGETGGFLKTGIYMSIIIIFFVGILMHAVIKSDRI